MANGSYIASAAEAERNRRFQAEQNYQSREMQKGMFGAELDFKKTQYNNLWDIQKANLDAERSIVSKYLINKEKDSSYENRMNKIENMGFFETIRDKDVSLGEWWNPKDNVQKPVHEEYTRDDLKNIDLNTLLRLVNSNIMSNARTQSNTDLINQMNLINQSGVIRSGY